MKQKLFLLLLVILSCVGCVGTVEETSLPYSEVTSAPETPITFPGIFSISAVSDTKAEVFFYPAVGGSGKYTYDIIVGSSGATISIPSDVLQADYRGILRYTLTGLTRLSTYQVKVEVRDNDTNYQSNSGVIKSVTTFENEVADFMGIGSVSNLAGQDGKDSIKIRWTPARSSGSIVKKDWDPKSYEVVLVDTQKLTPNDMDIPYTNADGRWRFEFNHDDAINEYIVRGLPAQTKFYIRMRAIHEASVNDVYNPRKKSELNTSYATIATLSANLADINFQPQSYAVSLADGDQGLNAVTNSWTAATGVFDHYRIYYSLVGGGVASGTLPTLCLSPMLSPVSATTFCKKVDFSLNNSPVTGLTSYTNYEMVLVLCATSTCGPAERIVAPYRTIKTDPNFPAFNGVKDIRTASALEDIGNIFLEYETPIFTLGYFDGLILKMRRTTDGSDTEVVISETSPTVFHRSYNFLSDNQIVIKGINYLDTQPYCFTLYPYKLDTDGITKRELPNNVWKCVQPLPEAPSSLQFQGIRTAIAQYDMISLEWEPPTRGIFSHYEIFWRKQSGAGFLWGDAIAQAGNNFNFTNYGRILIDSEETEHTLTGFANGTYYVGILTYFNYINNDGSVVIRSETNGAIKRCTINNALPDAVNCN